MSNSLKISIITVSLNSESTIKDTIESVLFQDYPNIEYLVIDGGSIDKTVEIVNSYHDLLSYVISENDDGIYDAINKGIKQATGDVIGILNSDDFYPCAHIISDVLYKFNKNIDAVYGDLVYIDPFEKDKVTRYWRSFNFSRKKIRRGWTLPHPTFFVRK